MTRALIPTSEELTLFAAIKGYVDVVNLKKGKNPKEVWLHKGDREVWDAYIKRFGGCPKEFEGIEFKYL